MATTFRVEGPFAVPFTKKTAGRIITSDDATKFWDKHLDLGSKRGCYVFGIRAGKGSTPGYVGKASSTTFQQEAFTDHKRNRYNEQLADYHKGTPVLLLVIAPSKKGKPNAKDIGELERFLIDVALAANPDLTNEKGTKQEEWAISGVLRSGKGKPGKAAKALTRMLKIAGAK